MSRTTGDLTSPLHRIVSPVEAGAIRRAILRRLGRAWGRTLAQYGTFAVIFGVAGLVDWWLSGRIRWQSAVMAEAVVAGIFTTLALYQSRRLLALGTLGSLPVHRAVVALHDGYARLHSPREFKKQTLFSWNYRLYPLSGDEYLSPEHVWQVDLVRTRHGGPEQYFVLAAEPLRPATAEERQRVNAYLWEVGVYQHTD